MCVFIFDLNFILYSSSCSTPWILYISVWLYCFLHGRVRLDFVNQPLENLVYFNIFFKIMLQIYIYISVEVACWMHTGERQAAKMRMAYLRAMLNQDISLFDTEASTGEVISAITSDIIVVQDALSEKVRLSC